MNTDTLPEPIERQLANLEAKHLRHQAKMEEQHEAKHEARRRHKAGWHKRRLAPIHYTYP